jgi:enoyl-CoA hydratase/carnithine racemase
MGYRFLIYEEKDHIGILTLNRPEKRNALSREFEDEIIVCLEDAAKRWEAKVIIIKAAGEVFCSGHDRSEILNASASSIRRLFQTSVDMMMTLRKIPQPVIAEVHGIAMAGGCHLAAACDLVIAAEKKAKFGMTGIMLGYNCSTPTVAVSRCVGQKKCMEMLLTGKLYSAYEAMTMGLVNRVVPDEKLGEETMNWARDIATKSRPIIAVSKQVFYAQAEMTEWQAYHYAKEMMALNAILPDAIEGFKANIEGRDPEFPEELG